MFAWRKRAAVSVTALLLPIVLIAALLPIFPEGAAAKEDTGGLRVSAEFGYGGKVNEGRWNPLTVTLTSGEDLTGDLVVQVAPQNGMGESTYVRRVELPAGTAKEVTLAIPGGSYSRNTSMIRFYPGSVEKGDAAPFREGRAYLSSSSQYGGIVGVLASDPDTMNFLSLLQSSGQTISVVPLEADDIGGNPMLLDGLDVLVLNDFASDTLSEEQLGAIRTWVERGGSLLLGGGAGYAKTAAGLEDLSPVEVSGGTESVSAAPLAGGGGGKALPAGSSLTAAKASAKAEASVRYSSGGLPLIASMPVQAGRVWYSAYDLSLAPLSSWAGSADLWGKLLTSDLSAATAVGGGVAVPSFSSNYYNLSYALDYFPSLHMPKLSVLVWLLLIYVVIAAPILYLILRKFDKREWAWVLIPLIAIVSSAAIYMTGSSDKTNELAHTLSYVTLDGEGEGLRRSATALFVPNSGNYKVDFPAGTQVSMMSGDNWMGGSGGQVSGQLNNFVREQPDGTQLRLGGMSYWSVAKFTVEEPEGLETGKLDAELKIDEQGEISGRVVNDTNARLTDAALVAGGKLYKLGQLEPGGEATIGKGMTLTSGYYDIGSFLFSTPMSGNDPYVRQRSMTQNIPGSGVLNGVGMQNAFLMAFAEDSGDKLTAGGKSVTNDRLSMYTQPVTVELIREGEVNIPYGYVGGSVIHTNTTQVGDDGMGRVSASPGTMTIGYSLPDLEGVNYEQLDVRLPDGRVQTATLEIWNEAEKKWQPIDWKTGAVSENYKQADDYVTSGGQVQIRVRVNEWTTMALPEIKLKGAVQP
ncbi:hypothetical protein [Saccharibacillus alkalitolerans]|uniref:Glutamine amidotransferase domain-containing protein n=1 Tax=Saccharibacillus alkalitolerans TaxID=2705290 RepID=A0ABX0F9V2_9BACL|nr:hypothetical protein [Saccharibacillus alkalitolerans]NGZ76001.1 hypothetical protein [Saccharibacillus alkalitolerans]